MDQLRASLKNPFHFPIDNSPPLYISQILDGNLDSLLRDFIHKLNSFQVRAHQKTPLKAKRQRRLIYGAREVQRALDRNRIKFIITATNLDAAFVEDDNWVNIKETAYEKNIQIVYGLSRKEISLAVAGNPRVDISVVGVVNVDGAFEESREIQEKAKELSSAWIDLILSLSGECQAPLSCIAAYFGHTELFSELRNKGLADGFIPASGDTVSHLAAARGHASILRLSCTSEDQLEKNYAQQYPTQLAALYNRSKTIKYLETVSLDTRYYPRDSQ